MRNHAIRVVVAALVATFAVAAGAHEFECEKDVGLLEVGENGPVLGEDGLPVFRAAPTPVLRISQYPATIGFDITLRNLAQATSVVRVAGDPLLEGLGDLATWFGASIAPGLEVPIGGSARTIVAVKVGSQAECLQLLAGGTFDAPVCQDVVENRFFVEHDVGSAECRARIVCLPEPTCETPWGGPTVLDFVRFPYHVEVDARCNANVTGYMEGPDREDRPFVPFLARLGPGGEVDQLLQFWLETGWTGSGRSLTVDGGSRFVAWEASPLGTTQLLASRFEADGSEAWRRPVREGVTDAWIALAPSGDPYVAAHVAPATPYVARLDAATGAVLWEREYAFPFPPRVTGFGIDAAGNLMLAGDTTDPTGDQDAFAARLDPAGKVLWIERIETPADDQTVWGADVDPAGSTYLGGWSWPPLGSGRPAEAFLTRLDPLGNVLWTSRLAAADPSSAARIAGVAVAPDGSARVVGHVNAALPGETWAGGGDVFVARYGAGGDLLWVNQLGGPDDDMGVAIALDPLGNAYAVYDMDLVWHVAKLDPGGNVQ